MPILQNKISPKTLVPLVIKSGPKAKLAGLNYWIIEAEWCIYASVQLTTIGSNNGLLPRQQQAIIWTNVVLLLIGALPTNFNEI